MKKFICLFILFVLIIISYFFISHFDYNETYYTIKDTYEKSTTNFIKIINEVNSEIETNFTIKVVENIDTYWTKTFKLNGDPAEELFINTPASTDYYIEEVVPLNYTYTVEYSMDGINYNNLVKTDGKYKFTISTEVPKIYLKVINTYNNNGGFTANDSINVSASIFSNSTLKNVLENANHPDGSYDAVNKVFTGLNPNNYLWYSGLMWRIIGINPDGSVKMITQNQLATLNYHSTSSEFSTSFIYKWLDEISGTDLYDGVFYNSLHNPSNFIQSTLLCAGTYSTDECNATKSFNGNVGLLRSSEYAAAGGVNSYLKISDFQWTMSTSSTNVRVINNSGFEVNLDPASVCQIRPVVVLKNTLVVSGGDGTSTNPYRLVGDESATPSTPLNDRYAGEYINYSGYVWRIVGVNDNNTIKLILNSSMGDHGFNEDPLATIPQLFRPESRDPMSIGFDLWNSSNVYFSNLEYIASGTWYLGQWERTYDYRVTITNSTGEYSPVTANVGLIRIGEIFSGNDLDDNTKIWHTITPKIVDTFEGTAYTTSHTNVLSATGQLATATQSLATNYLVAVRPVINMISNICITSGSGTPESPYNISTCN